MQLLARRIGPDEVEQEITQRDQFNTDAVGLAETLIRESHQNSMDGATEPGVIPVRTRITFVEGRPSDAEFWGGLLGPLLPHLEACGVDTAGIDLARPRFLVIEDFGTTGLCGAYDRKDKGGFSDFWRRNGISHKGGGQAGRWGLGKLVFSSASRIRSFFGLTIRSAGEAGPLLMGQAVLKVRELATEPGVEYASHAFFAIPGPTGLQLPTRAQDYVDRFKSATGISRVGETGLSIVIPYPLEPLTVDSLVPDLIRNWFFPILMGDLEVEIGSLILDRDTFSDLAQTLGGADFADGQRVVFLQALRDARNRQPSVTLQAGWTANGIESALTADELATLRADFEAGKLIEVRAPLALKPKTGAARQTYVDLFLMSNPQTPRGDAFFVRGSITVPGEAAKFRGRHAFGALVARDEAIVAFLGDAEGPAHTTWSGNAEKLKANWKNPGTRLGEIRESLTKLYETVAQVVDKEDKNALRHLFNVKAPDAVRAARPRNPLIRPPRVPPIPRSPRQYRLERRESGFVVYGASGTELPLRLTLAIAYDVSSGNPLSEYSELDFDLRGSEISIVASGATVECTNGNHLVVNVTEPGFSVLCTGFDPNRDLFVRDRTA